MRKDRKDFYTKLLQYIHDYQKVHFGDSPSDKLMGLAIGRTSQTVRKYLNEMEREGLISIVPGGFSGDKKRKIKVLT